MCEQGEQSFYGVTLNNFSLCNNPGTTKNYLYSYQYSSIHGGFVVLVSYLFVHLRDEDSPKCRIVVIPGAS